MRTGGFALFPLDGVGGIAESAPELAPMLPAQGAPTEGTQREHPRSAFASASFPGGPCASSPALLGGSGLTGSGFSRRCCRIARRPAGRWSCTGGHRSARTSSASWTSTRTSTRGGSVSSSSWSGESPVPPLRVGSPHRSSRGGGGDAERGGEHLHALLPGCWGPQGDAALGEAACEP